MSPGNGTRQLRSPLSSAPSLNLEQAVPRISALPRSTGAVDRNPRGIKLSSDLACYVPSCSFKFPISTKTWLSCRNYRVDQNGLDSESNPRTFQLRQCLVRAITFSTPLLFQNPTFSAAANGRSLLGFRLERHQVVSFFKLHPMHQTRADFRVADPMHTNPSQRL